MHVCVSACVCECACVSISVCVCECKCECVRVCVSACVCECVRACVCVFVCVVCGVCIHACLSLSLTFYLVVFSFCACIFAALCDVTAYPDKSTHVPECAHIKLLSDVMQ